MYHNDNSNVKKIIPEGMFLRMVDDTERLNKTINPALENLCIDKVVIDLGCGSGILGLHALENGAKFVYFVEQDTYMVEILQNVLPKIIDPSKFKIIHKYAQDLTESDFDNSIPEICVSELFGILLFDEGYYQCTAPIKKIFKDLVFIPEIFHLDVFECDPNFGNLPWPENETRLVEHYKYMYATIGWCTNHVGKGRICEFLNPKKIGEISYNANTGVFNNTLSAVILPIDGKMINLSGKTISNGMEQGGPKFGWYVPPSDKEVVIDILIHKDIEDANVYFSVNPYNN
jgi:16S rRNA G966 N2-methylase RsmD